MTTTIHHMPNGTPAPAVMTPKDVVEFLQINTGNVTVSARTLKRHGLRTAKTGNEDRCSLSEVLAFVERQLDGSEQ